MKYSKIRSDEEMVGLHFFWRQKYLTDVIYMVCETYGNSYLLKYVDGEQNRFEICFLTKIKINLEDDVSSIYKYKWW